MKTPISARLSAVLLTPLILMLAVGWPAIAAAGQRQKAAVVKIAEFNEVGDEVSLGKNRTEEACRLRLVQDRERKGAGGVGHQRYHLFCEGWSQPSGEIRRFRARMELPPARLVSESGWQQDFANASGQAESTRSRDGRHRTRQCKAQRAGGRSWSPPPRRATLATFEASPRTPASWKSPTR
jgi:hypothetical protein